VVSVDDYVNATTCSVAYVEDGDGEGVIEIVVRFEYQTSISSLQVATEDSELLGVDPEQTICLRVCQQHVLNTIT